MKVQGSIASFAVLVAVVVCSLPGSWGVPVQPAVPVQQPKAQLTSQDESMIYSAATYLLGRWLASTPTTAASPQNTVPTPAAVVPTTPPAPTTTVAPRPTVSKQAKNTDLEESSGYSLVNLFMVVLRAVLGANGQQQLLGAPQAPQSTQKCNCPGQTSSPSSPVGGDSLSQTAMRALLMVVTDVLSNQLTSNSAASSAPSPSRGYFW